MTKMQKWLRFLRWLRKEFPTQKPAIVRSVNMEDDADVDLVGGKFVIYINKRKPYSTMCDSVMHEWAHALVWFGAGREVEHSDEWGLWYAKIYQAWDRWEPDVQPTKE
jgi:hypothetical protein